MQDESRQLPLRTACRVLADVFGYPSFRPGQGELVEALLAGRDVLGVMPTGGGKSLCYQVPALVRPGVALVISPLVSLMDDQVRALSDAGVRAALLNSSLSASQQGAVMNQALVGAFDLLYVAPERLSDPRFVDFAARASLSLIAVDEAHCVSQWGQDFRPSYLTIGQFVASLPNRPPVGAFTATATDRVRADIVRLLGLRDPFTLVTGFDRPNLHLAVERLEPKRKIARIAAKALARPADSGIVYCSTRKDVEKVHEALVAAGVKATRYHAGLSHGERAANQAAFINDDAPVMVATNAFGMGIDKSNVRYVVHHNMPASMEAYYQEAGRAGRDGEPAECILYWSDGDISTGRFFIEQESENEELTPEEAERVRAVRRRMLESMVGYGYTTECLRRYILRYFGEEAGTEGARGASDAGGLVGGGPAGGSDGEAGASAAGKREDRGSKPFAGGAHDAAAAADELSVHQKGCGNCGNCDGGFKAVDVTAEARAVMRCVQAMRGRFGKSLVADVLRGMGNERVCDLGLQKLPCFGDLGEGWQGPGSSAASPSLVREVVELLAAGDYLVVTEGTYPTVGFGPRFREAAAADFRLLMKQTERVPKVAHGSAGARGAFGQNSGGRTFDGAGGSGELSGRTFGVRVADSEAEELFEQLRVLRKSLADAMGKPPYVVFSDATLRAMATARPATDEEFLEIPGVGLTKLKRYGEDFMAAIREFEKGER